MKQNAGQITLGIGALIATGTVVASVITSYFTNELKNQENFGEIKSSLQIEVSADRQRISAVEEGLKTIKDSQLETQRDVKELLRRVK